uniref:Progonadoliberin n=1 Tax=Malurus cyaneus samueli TaxID=2593467 RepID=A0A8C5T2Y2_9PASS
MAPRGSLLLLALLLLSCALPLARGQHWSHGWYPGGKRDLRTPQFIPAGISPTRGSIPAIPSVPFCRSRRSRPLPGAAVPSRVPRGGRSRCR